MCLYSLEWLFDDAVFSASLSCQHHNLVSPTILILPFLPVFPLLPYILLFLIGGPFINLESSKCKVAINGKNIPQ